MPQSKADKELSWIECMATNHEVGSSNLSERAIFKFLKNTCILIYRYFFLYRGSKWNSSIRFLIFF